MMGRGTGAVVEERQAIQRAGAGSYERIAVGPEIECRHLEIVKVKCEALGDRLGDATEALRSGVREGQWGG